MLREMNLDTFVNELASVSPAPGGGSTAGLAASLGAALTSMVFNLTIDRKVAKDYPESIVTSMKEARQVTDSYREKYLELMVDDVNAFDSLMSAYCLPKETEEEKLERSEKISKAKELVLTVPLNLLNESFAMYDALKVATEYGNKNAISDAGVAAILIHSAIEGAALNVFINLASSEANDENISLKNSTDDLVEKSRVIKEDIVSAVIDKIYGRQ